MLLQEDIFISDWNWLFFLFCCTFYALLCYFALLCLSSCCLSHSDFVFAVALRTSGWSSSQGWPLVSLQLIVSYKGFRTQSTSATLVGEAAYTYKERAGWAESCSRYWWWWSIRIPSLQREIFVSWGGLERPLRPPTAAKLQWEWAGWGPGLWHCLAVCYTRLRALWAYSCPANSCPS